MQLEELEPELLWRYYQRGYHCLVRNGLYFRQLLRPALSHVYFHRAVPLLQQYARANHDDEDLPPGFSDQMEACPLTPRDLLHLDYAICLGYAEALGVNSELLAEQPIMEWPGPSGYSGLFIAADAVIADAEPPAMEAFEEMDEAEEASDEDEDSEPPFDL